MDKRDFDRFCKAFNSMCEIWEKDASPTLQAVYFKALERYTIDDVERGITTAMVSLKFWPKPVELLDAITGGPQQVEDESIIESTKVLQAVKRIGGYQSVVFNNQITNAVIQEGFGGWVKMCSEQGSGAEKWFIRDFSAMYKAFRRSGRQMAGHLPGRCEIENNANGYDDNAVPVMIGDDGHGKVKMIELKN